MLAENLFGSLPADRSPSWRTLEYIALIRVLIVSTLVLVVAAFGPPLGGAGVAGAPRLLVVGLVYFVFAASLAILTLFVRSNFALQLGGQLAIDLMVRPFAGANPLILKASERSEFYGPAVRASSG